MSNHEVMNDKVIKYLDIKTEGLLNILSSATNQLLVSTNYHHSIYKSLEIVGNGYHFDQIQVYRFNGVFHYFQIEMMFEWNKQLIINSNLQFNQEEIHTLYKQLAIKDIIIHNDRKDALQLGKSSIIIAIKYNNELKGFIKFDNRQPLISQEMIQLLSIYSNALTLSIERFHREKEIEQLSYRDSLTDLYSRRYFEQEFSRIAVRDHLPISMIVADINGLKLVNDSFGHVQGDAIIQSAAKLLKRNLRDYDIIARWGGDEFTILLPKTNTIEAQSIVEKILKEASKTYMDFIPVSISLATSTVLNEDINLNKLFIDAEDQMYKKKMIDSPIIKRKIIQSIMNTLYARSKSEERHSKRVSELCAQIGQALNFDEFGVKHLRAVGLYHDIGKIAIQEKYLNKTEWENNEEYDEYKRHAEIGYRILSTVNEMADIADFILKHHERIDGKGFPYGLKGDKIPLITKILTVADAYETMSANPLYNKNSIIQELIKKSCSQFDHIILRALFEKVLKEPWYSVLYGVNNTVIKCGEPFDPLEGVFVIDSTDPLLSTQDIKISGIVNNNQAGNYEIIYTITNAFGKVERITRKVSVGEFSELCIFDFKNKTWDKIEIDGASFDYIPHSNEIDIHLTNGGSNSWSAQLIHSGIHFEKDKQYVVSFDAYTDLSKKEIQLSIGMLDGDNNYWHSFLSTTNNKFYITPYKQTYKLIFRMESETCLNSDLKFEFGTGEKTHLNISNIQLFEFNEN